MRRQRLNELSSPKELVLKGDLVLHRVDSLKEEMQAALEGSDQLLIHLGEARSFDLAFLQLLCSAHRSAVLLGKSLSLAGNLPEDFTRRAEEAGFARHVGCRLDCQNSCIWMVQGD
jgi:anti-anti-sigma regulatory factor